VIHGTDGIASIRAVPRLSAIGLQEAWCTAGSTSSKIARLLGVVHVEAGRPAPLGGLGGPDPTGGRILGGEKAPRGPRVWEPRAAGFPKPGPKQVGSRFFFLGAFFRVPRF